MAAAPESSTRFEPRITAFVCNWCTYTGADLAGTSRLQMADNVRIIRLPCTGRIDPLFIIKAFERGADGVIVSGCHPADCHYTAGNYHARRRFAVLKELLELLGVEPGRLTFSWVSASEGNKWQDVVDTATAAVRRLGPFDAYHSLAAASPARHVDLSGLAPAGPVPAQPAVEAAAAAPATELQNLARTLLAEGKVGVVIGWEEGPRGARPAFITHPEDAARLIFDSRCVHNLAAYLSPRRSHLAPLGRKAVVVKPCDAKAVAGLIRETQIAREDVVLIGVRCGGVLADPESDAVLTPETVAKRCSTCGAREPRLADVVVGPSAAEPPASSLPDQLARLEAMAPGERWAFWQRELERCVRCHACREVCPLCFCERCVAEKTQPQWIESSPHPRGNFAWHVARAIHLAGRCVGCGECTRACPAGIPLALLNMKVAKVMKERFGYVATDDPAVPCPVGTFRQDDAQEFIR